MEVVTEGMKASVAVEENDGDHTGGSRRASLYQDSMASVRAKERRRINGILHSAWMPLKEPSLHGAEAKLRFNKENAYAGMNRQHQHNTDPFLCWTTRLSAVQNPRRWPISRDE